MIILYSAPHLPSVWNSLSWLIHIVLLVNCLDILSVARLYEINHSIVFDLQCFHEVDIQHSKSKLYPPFSILFYIHWLQIRNCWFISWRWTDWLIDWLIGPLTSCHFFIWQFSNSFAGVFDLLIYCRHECLSYRVLLISGLIGSSRLLYNAVCCHLLFQPTSTVYLLLLLYNYIHFITAL